MGAGHRLPSLNQRYTRERHTPLRSATDATVAPGANTSDRIRRFSSSGQCRRRSTVEIISATMSHSVHNHVDKDSMPHTIRHPPTTGLSRSLEGTLTDGESDQGVPARSMR